MTARPASPAARARVERILLGELWMPGAGSGAERAAELLGLLGDPQDQVPVVHIAGTAGKGSVAGFLTAVLTAHGFRVGTHVSPHVHDVLERFQLDGTPAPAELVLPALEAVRGAGLRLSAADCGPPTFPEVAAATAFRLFADRPVDYAVVETGLGGLLDATNTVTRSDKLALLTTMGLDHTAVLGSTIAEIATQKAGILPRDGVCLALPSGPESDSAVLLRAERRRCSVRFVDPDDVDALVPPDRALGLPGEHQRANAALAVRAAAVLAGRDGWDLDADLTAAALAGLRMPGRFEERATVCGPVVLDGAHNPIKLAALRRSVETRFPGRPVGWVLSLKQDKDLPAALRALAPGQVVVATRYAERAGRPGPVEARTLAEAALAAGARVAEDADDLAEAIARAHELAEGPVVVTGSFFLVEEAGRLCP